MTGPLPYIGGKHRLAKLIASLFPPHTTYVEPFAGGAQVFFHKQPSKVEILNDMNGEIVNFFRVVQWHHSELVSYLRHCLMGRKVYGWLSSTDPETLTDVQRACRFYYLQKNSFGGLVVKQNYHYTVAHKPNYNVGRIPETIRKASERLHGVQIECLPYDTVLKKYDRAETLFYLDPPYWGRSLYRYNFKEEDFIALEKRLHKVKGKFILSLNDVPEVRKLFKAWHIRSEVMAYSAQRKVGKKYGELLIANFRL